MGEKMNRCGWKLSEETKRKLSASHTGIVSWNKGKHHSAETKLKMSKIRKGRVLTEGWKQKISDTLKGRSIGIKHKCSKEHKNKLSYANAHATSIHQKTVLNEINRLHLQGYKTLNGDLKPHPDIIAVKDGKIYAIEIEFGRPNIAKYNDIDFFDDVLWIKKSKCDINDK
jgi:hypothetical protein